jgi:hypothetical protein
MPHVWFPEGVPGEFPAFYVCRSGDVSIFNGFSAAKVSIAQRERNGKSFLQGWDWVLTGKETADLRQQRVTKRREKVILRCL